MAPGLFSTYQSTSTLLLPLLFVVLLNQKYQKYKLSSPSDLTLVSDRKGIDNPLSRWLRSSYLFVQVRGTSAWSPTGLIPWFSKTEGNTYATVLHLPFLFEGIQHKLKRYQEEFLAPLPGRLTQKSYAKYLSQTLILHITFICLSFSSPPIHPCHLIRPFF